MTESYIMKKDAYPPSSTFADGMIASIQSALPCPPENHSGKLSIVLLVMHACNYRLMFLIKHLAFKYQRILQ